MILRWIHNRETKTKDAKGGKFVGRDGTSCDGLFVDQRKRTSSPHFTRGSLLDSTTGESTTNTTVELIAVNCATLLKLLLLVPRGNRKAQVDSRETIELVYHLVIRFQK